MSEYNEYGTDTEYGSDVAPREAGKDAVGDVGQRDTEIVQRSAERAVVSYLGIVVVSENEMMQAELVDLSAAGACMVIDSSFDPVGEFVLKVPETGASFVSEVVWQKERTCGVRFLRPCKD